MDLTIQHFLSNLKSHGSRVDLVPLLSFFSFDTICRLAFSDALGSQADCEAALEGGRQRFRYWHKWFAVPDLESLLYKNRFRPGAGTPSALGSLAQKRLADRIEKGGAGVHNDLLDRFLQAQKGDPATFNTSLVMGLGESISVSASDCFSVAHSAAPSVSSHRCDHSR